MRVSIWMILVAMAAVAISSPATSQEGSLAAVSELAQRGDRAEALRQLDAFLASQPNHFEALLLKGNLLVEIGRGESAEAIFSSLIKRFPDRPEAYNNMAVLQARAGRYEEAAESLLRALETHPSYRVAYQNLGKVYGQFASQAYSKALGVQHPQTSPGVDLMLLSNAPPTEPATPRRPPPHEDVPIAAARPAPVPVPVPVAPQEPPTEVPPQTPTQTQTQTPTQTPTQSPPPPQTQAPPATDPGPPAEDGVASTIRSWARAWSEQRVDDYLHFYSSHFRPEDGSSRSEWAGQRRSRLRSPQFIRVVIRNLQASEVSSERAVVSFTQSYASDNFSDVVDKRLVLQREGEAWKIVEEVVTP